MNLSELLGRSWTLPIRRFAEPGAFLGATDDDTPDAPVILLPRREVPPKAVVGDEVQVFVYLDSEDRPIATTASPKLQLNEVAFLQVTSCTKIGAFVDWGLMKELLVPFANQTRELRVGDLHPIALYLDNSNRLTGTMRITELLEKDASDFKVGEWVQGDAWRNDPDIGLFVIVERGFVGLVPRHEPHRLARGQSARFRVSSLLPDGKMELSLRALAHEQLDSDGEMILKVLARPGTPRVGDHSSPEEIRRLFGLSKKAFKRAVGGLLKRGQVRLAEDGALVRAR